MAEFRGINHSAMEELVGGSGPIQRFMAEIDEFFNILKTQYPTRVAEAYGGKAADTFVQKLQASADSMKESVAVILDECTKVANQKADAYRSQEYAAMQSVEADAGNGADESL